MILSTYKCDYCGELKKESNHWWLVSLWSHPRSFSVQSFETASRDQLTGGFGADEVFHLCGSACVTAKVNAFISAPLTTESEGR